MKKWIMNLIKQAVREALKEDREDFLREIPKEKKPLKKAYKP